MNQKAQVIVIDVLFFSLIVVFIVYLELLYISQIGEDTRETDNSVKYLENLIFVDKLISDCNYFAKIAINYDSLCYQNIIDIKAIPELKERKICKIEVSGIVEYSDSITETKYIIERGIVNGGAFKKMSVYFCK